MATGKRHESTRVAWVQRPTTNINEEISKDWIQKAWNHKLFIPMFRFPLMSRSTSRQLPCYFQVFVAWVSHVCSCLRPWFFDSSMSCVLLDLSAVVGHPLMPVADSHRVPRVQCFKVLLVVSDCDHIVAKHRIRSCIQKSAQQIVYLCF